MTPLEYAAAVLPGVLAYALGKWVGRTDARDESFNAGYVAGHRAALAESADPPEPVGVSRRG